LWWGRVERQKAKRKMKKARDQGGSGIRGEEWAVINEGAFIAFHLLGAKKWMAT
jgi:hypothetical protein